MTTELVKSEERANSSEPVAERTTLDEPLPRERRYKLSEKIIATQDIHRGYTLVYNLRRGTIRRCSNAFWRAINFENRWGGYVAWRPELKDLVKDKFLIPLDSDEQEETLEDKLDGLRRGMSSQLYWSFWPTANCNLACDYCGQTHSNTKLSREHCDLAVQLVRRRLKVHGFKRLHVSWFGGEPLLGLDIMRYLTPQLFKTAKELGIDYDARLITNGTLMTKRVSRELMNQLGIVWIDITLDGPRAVHDKRRGTRKGAGTYDWITRNIADFFEVRGSKRTTRLTLRCNVDARNAGAAKELIDHLESLGFSKEVSNINFAAVFPWGDPPGQRYRYRNRRKYAKLNLEISEYALSKSFNCSVLPLGRGGTCQASALDTTVNVLPGGRLYLCGEIPLVAGYDERDDRWWDKGTLEQLREQQEEDIVFSSGWFEEIRKGKWPCTSCKWFGLCSGECPKQCRDGHGGCPYYIFNFPERMRAYSRLELPVPENAEEERPRWQVVSKILKRFRVANVP